MNRTLSEALGPSGLRLSEERGDSRLIHMLHFSQKVYMPSWTRMKSPLPFWIRFRTEPEVRYENGSETGGYLGESEASPFEDFLRHRKSVPVVSTVDTCS